jgi:RimJ/RimL family protein N-acetyltransferase
MEQSVQIRPIMVADAQPFLDLRLQLDRESAFMMYEPGERSTDLCAARGELELLLASPNQTVLVAIVDDALVGYISVHGGEFRRSLHCAYVVTGVLGRFAGRGIGTRLFEAGETWARDQGIRRLELTVMVHNVVAIRLYERRGFVNEGTRKGSMLVDGALVDEFYMGKLLS